MEKRNIVAVVGFVVIIPAVLICLSGLLRLEPPQILTHPVVVLAGLALALATNILHLAHLSVRLEDGTLVGAVTIRLRGRAMNFGVIVLSCVLLAAIASYLFLENFQPR